MKAATLVIFGLDETEVLKLLHAPDSGFEVDLRQPLRSLNPNDIAIAGLVLSAAQLALTIYQIHQSDKKPTQDTGVRVEIIHPDGRITKIEGQNLQKIEIQLESE